MLDVYAASEAPIEGISGQTIVDHAGTQGFSHLSFVRDRDEVVDCAVRDARPGDTILTLGAGDVGRLCDGLLEKLASAANVPESRS